MEFLNPNVCKNVPDFKLRSELRNLIVQDDHWLLINKVYFEIYV